MKIDQTSLDHLKISLRSTPEAQWLRIAAQLLDFGDEVNFYIILPSIDVLGKSFNLFSKTIREALYKYTNTEFYCTFYIRKGRSEVLGAYIVDDELRSGRLAIGLGEQFGSRESDFDDAFWTKHQ